MRLNARALLGASTCVAVAVVAAAVVMRRRRRLNPQAAVPSQGGTSGDNDSVPHYPPRSPTCVKFFFWVHSTWEAAPKMVPVGTSDKPVARPTTAQGWLELGWSLPTGHKAWLKQTAEAVQVSEMTAYVEGLALDGRNATLWLLLGIALMGAEEALTAESRAALDDDEAPDLLWTISVPGYGSRLYAVDCLQRALELGVSDMATAWAALGRYCDITHIIAKVQNEPVTAVDCFRRAVKLKTSFTTVAPQFVLFCVRHNIPGLMIEEGEGCSISTASMASLTAGYNDPVIWRALADIIVKESETAAPSARPLVAKVFDQSTFAVDCALEAVRLDPCLASWQTLSRSVGRSVGMFDFESRCFPDGTPVTLLEVRERAVAAFPSDVELCVLLGGIIDGSHALYASCLDGVWKGAKSRAEVAVAFREFVDDLVEFRYTDPETKEVHSLEQLCGESIAKEPDNAKLWGCYARLANLIQGNDPQRTKFIFGKDGEGTIEIDEITARAVWLQPSSPTAWYDCVAWSRRHGQTFRVNGIDLDSVSVWSAIVDRNPSKPSTFCYLADALIESGQSHATLRDQLFSPEDCAKNAVMRDNLYAAPFRMLGHISKAEVITFNDGQTITRQDSFLRALRLMRFDDALCWVQLGLYLATLPPKRQMLDLSGDGLSSSVTPHDCWLKGVVLSRPHRRPRALAIGLTALAGELESDDAKIAVALRRNDGSVEERQMNRIELLCMAADVSFTAGLPSDQWRNRLHTATALRNLAALLGPDETVCVVGRELTKDGIFEFAHRVIDWSFDAADAADESANAVAPEPAPPAATASAAEAVSAKDDEDNALEDVLDEAVDELLDDVLEATLDEATFASKTTAAPVVHRSHVAVEDDTNDSDDGDVVHGHASAQF